MKKQLLSISFLLLGVTTLLGQNIATKRLPLELSVSGGAEFANFTNLNHRLRAQDLKKQGSFLMTGAIGIAYRTKPLLFGIQHSMSGDFSDNDFRQNYLRFYLSTHALQFGSIVVAPELGIGYQDTRAFVVVKESSGTFDDFLQTDANRIRVDQQGTVADVGISFKRHVRERNVYLPFFRVGYKHGLYAGGWQIANAQTTGAPADRVRGFYAQLTAGIGR